MNRHMKHVKVLSTEKPVCAEQVAWVEFKNIFGPLKLRPEQQNWLVALIDNWLQS
ncbi:MAG: hypothetical protein AMXMBFR82_28010 [Candidatus Hydrogenedentota bacterium]